MPLTLSGTEASVRWGYHVAASVTAWSIIPDDGRLTFTASLVQSDHYRLSQRPLVFVVTRKGVTLRWPILELQINGATVTATLGQKDK